jgi:hypothetical protein
MAGELKIEVSKRTSECASGKLTSEQASEQAHKLTSEQASKRETMTKQILECINCDNRFYEFDSDKICMYCDTLDHEDIEILMPHELRQWLVYINNDRLSKSQKMIKQKLLQ